MRIDIFRGSAEMIGELLNCELRRESLSIEYAESYNEMFVRIFGMNHESMKLRRKIATTPTRKETK